MNVLYTPKKNKANALREIPFVLVWRDMNKKHLYSKSSVANMLLNSWNKSSNTEHVG